MGFHFVRVDTCSKRGNLPRLLLLLFWSVCFLSFFPSFFLVDAEGLIQVFLYRILCVILSWGSIKQISSLCCKRKYVSPYLGRCTWTMTVEVSSAFQRQLVNREYASICVCGLLLRHRALLICELPVSMCSSWVYALFSGVFGEKGVGSQFFHRCAVYLS